MINTIERCEELQGELAQLQEDYRSLREDLDSMEMELQGAVAKEAELMGELSKVKAERAKLREALKELMEECDYEVHCRDWPSFIKAERVMRGGVQ